MSVPAEIIIGKAAQPRTRFGVQVILVIAVLLPLSIAVITGNALSARSVDADTLVTLAFLRDIFLHGGHLADWNFSQHSDLFPDKLLSAVSYGFSDRPENWLLIFEALDLSLYFGIAWYCLWLCLSRQSKRTETAYISLWGALVVSALPPLLRSWGLFDRYLRYIGIPSNHFGAFFCAILASFIAIDCLERPASGRTIARLSAACALIMLCGISDKLTIIVAVPGFLAAALYVVAMRRSFSGVLVGCSSALCASAAFSYFANDPIWNALAELAPAKPAFDPTWVKLLVRPMLRSLLTGPDVVANIESNDDLVVPASNDWNGLSDLIIHLDPLRVVIVAVTLLGAFGLASTYVCRATAALSSRSRIPLTHVTADAFIVYLVANFFLIPSALLAAGVLMERYAYPAGYCILWAGVASFARRIPSSVPRSRLVLGFAVTGALLSAMPIDFSAPPFRRLSSPPLIRCLEEFGKTHDLRLGLASHWETYPIDIFSEGRILVRAIKRDGLLSHWDNNIEWYAPAAGKLFTFVVASPELDEPGLRQRMGDPTEVLTCRSLGPGFGEREILYYDRAAAIRLTGSITEQYRQLKR